MAQGPAAMDIIVGSTLYANNHVHQPAFEQRWSGAEVRRLALRMFVVSEDSP